MPHAVRCPSCGGLSRVADDALGLAVECPACAAEFVADRAEPTTFGGPPRNPTLPVVPVVRPRDRFADPDGEEPELAPRRPVPGAVGLALLPLAVPLAWLVAPLLNLGKPIFSFAAPVSLALGSVGLGLGLAHCYGWSAGARLRAVVATVALSYALGLVLFLVNADWAVAVRRALPAPAAPLYKFTAPERLYSVTVPGRPEPVEGSPLDGWDLTAYRSGPPAERRDTFLQLVYEFAHGRPPAGELRRFTTTDRAFFDAVKAALAEATGGEVRAEPLVDWRTPAGSLTQGDFAVALPDGARRRVVRVVRDAAARRVYYFAVEGAFLPDDLGAVRSFFKSLEIPAK